MKVIFLALSIANSQDGGIYTDLVREFKEQGEDILVLAPAREDTGVGLQDEYGVKVLRVSANNLFHHNFIKKGIANILLPYHYKRALKRNSIKMDFDLILMSTPPITLTNMAAWVKRQTKNKARIYLILRDIFPQNAVDLNIMKPNGLFYHYFRQQEKKLYKVSDKIGCMSEANITYVKNHNKEVAPEKLHLLPNWKKLIHEPNQLKEINSALLQRMKNKFVVLFGGNLGKPQKLENIVDLAKSVADYDEIFFLIIGNGTEKEKVRTLIDSENLRNIELHDPIWSSEYQHVINASKVGLISLSEAFTIPNFPSKVLSYFSAKIPVLASIDLNTDFGTMLEETNSGFWAPAGNVQLLREKLLYLYHNEQISKQMGKNGYEYMCEYLLPINAYQTIVRNTKVS